MCGGRADLISDDPGEGLHGVKSKSNQHSATFDIQPWGGSTVCVRLASAGYVSKQPTETSERLWLHSSGFSEQQQQSLDIVTKAVDEAQHSTRASMPPERRLPL